MTYDPRTPNVDVLDMTDDEMDAALKPWTKDVQDAALREGWDLFDSRGSDAGPIQVQHIDDADLVEHIKVPQLDDDDQAMLMVMTGTGEHHRIARRIVAAFNPEDFRRMQYVADNFGKEQA